MKKAIPLLVLYSILTINVTAQTSPTASKVDALFADLTNQNSTGCAIGIIRNDSIIYAKGYGLANLEYGILNTPISVFNTASMAKQFTAYAIILLAQQKKVSFDDDIRKYLKWFPDLKEKITIGNLLNHTSGIRDQWDLAVISATDVTTQEQIIKLLSKQQALNFEPGERYSYCNSGYTLLAEIVKSVSGKSLRSFSDSAIFKPLGMNSTFFHDNINEVVKNRSYSYNRIDSIHFESNNPSSSIVGATSLFTTVNDISKWIMNFYNPKSGNKKSIELLTQKGKLNNGEELTYASGLYIDTYKGWKTFYHGGAEAGYISHLTVFPELKTGIVVLSNSGDVEAQKKVNEIADIIIPINSQYKNETKNIKRDSALTFLKDTSSVKKFIGTYMSETGTQRSIVFKNKRLYVGIQGQTYLLYPIKGDTFSLFSYPDSRLILSISSSGKDTIFERNDRRGNNKYKLKKYSEVVPSIKELQSYAGNYYCPELDSKQAIEFKDGQLILKYPKFDIPLTPIGNDCLLSGYCIVMLRNDKKEITGFEINGERTLHLKFDKINR